MNFFYDKKVEVWHKGSRVNAGGGFFTDSKPRFSHYEYVDIQPYTSAQAKRDYGFDIQCTHEMYSSDKSIEIGKTLIIYKSKEYEVLQKIEWETYVEYLLEVRK